MATRRSTDPPRTRAPEVLKEIPKVIRAAEPMATPAPRKAAAPRAKKSPQTPPVSATLSENQRRAMIAEGAYLRAEKRGFAPGHENEDWLAAESEVDRLLHAGHGGISQ